MIRTLLFAAGIALTGNSAIAENIQPESGGGVEHESFRDHISPVQRQAIAKMLHANRLNLQRSGVLQSDPARSESLSAQPLFDWPIAPTINEPGNNGVSNFVDHDASFPDSIEDYNCGARSYDTDSGYNHKGMDVFSWPFPWLKMDNNEVQIVAAEAGVILGKDDGNFDRNCSFTGDWNAVYVEHADGSVAWYGHLKKNSLIAKTTGQSVQAGEVIGTMGSSGQSTGPHLHMEVYDSAANLIDPSSGSCNTLNNDSWWNTQRPYYDAGINMVATHDAPPVMDNGCGVAETANFQQVFEPGQRAYFATYLRDQQAGQLIEMKIFQPDGSIWQQWSHSMNSPAFYAASWWNWSWILPLNPQVGEWRWNVRFEGQEAESGFIIIDVMFDDGFEDPE